VTLLTIAPASTTSVPPLSTTGDSEEPPAETISTAPELTMVSNATPATVCSAPLPAASTVPVAVAPGSTCRVA
jgi:hypothetical protein